MLNMNNICIFEGRTTSNQKFSQFNGQNGPVDKANFSISVPRILSAQQKQDPNAKKVDFINCSMIGAQVKTLQQHFPAGTPIKVVAKYTEYETVDSATGQKKYGNIFEVESIGFVTTPAQNQGQNGNGGNYQQNNGGYQQNNNGYQAPQNNGGYQQNYQQPAQNQPQQNYMGQPQQNAQQGNFQMFGEDNFPF